MFLPEEDMDFPPPPLEAGPVDLWSAPGPRLSYTPRSAERTGSILADLARRRTDGSL
jgi:hypothetical protein